MYIGKYSVSMDSMALCPRSSFLKKKTDPDSADNRKDTMTNKIDSPVHLVYELCIKVTGYSTNGLVI